MTFYVNQAQAPLSDWEHQCIALFDGNKWDGEGNFCGYYAAEYYLDTTILAYGIQLRKGCTIYNPKAPFDGGFFENVNAHFNKVPIGSALWEVKIEANSVEEAVRIFKSQSW